MDTASRTRDEWLTLRCQAGEAEAFEDLVSVMERPLIYYATKLLRNDEAALDVVQNVWVRVFGNIRRLKDPGSLRPWLYRVTHGIAVDHIRVEVSRERVGDVHAELSQDNVEPGFSQDDADAIHEGLDQLELKHREVLVLHFLEDFSVAEVAQVIGCPEGTIKSRIHHAKKAIREILMRGGYGT